MTRILETEIEEQRTISQICETFPNITYSRSDTTETIAQIQDHNAARDALCGR